MVHHTTNNIQETECKQQNHLKIDINEPATSESTKGETKELQLHPLDEAMKKYFLGDDTPSCRLLETEDAKKIYHEKTTTGENKSSGQEYNYDKQQGDSTIHCAQRNKQQTETGSPNYIAEIDGIIDLTSPMANTSAMWSQE